MQRLQGAFPTYGTFGNIPMNLFDATVGAGWGIGDTSIFAPLATPTLARPWTIYGYGVTGRGALCNQSSNAKYGQLGKVHASLIVGGSYNTIHPGAFIQPPEEAIPNLVTLWDGSTDQPFPWYNSSTPSNLPVGGEFHDVTMLTVPQPMAAGERLALGLWLTPMIASALLALIIYSCHYTVIYDV